MTDDELDVQVENEMGSGADIEELLTKAVGTMIKGACDGLMVNLGHSVMCDPQITTTYGERLLMRCVQELKK